MWYTLFMGSAAAAQSLGDTRSDPGTSSVWGGAWLSVVMLVLVLGLLALVLWLIRTYRHSNTTSAVHVLATHSLGPRDRILIVRIEDRILALGQTPSQINLLTELESFDAQVSAQPMDAPAFANLLNKFAGRNRT
jgi:flagellar protein FliO/FliZ